MTTKQNAESVLAKKAVLTVLTISQWSARRFDKKLTEDVHASHGMQQDSGRYNKVLLSKAALEKIYQASNKARQVNWDMTLPWMDMDGQRLLPTKSYLDYTNKMRQLKEEFSTAVAEFTRNYPAYVEEAKKRLNGAFNPADYPPADQVKHRFGFDVAIMKCPDADFRCEISEDDLKDIEADVKRRLDDGLQKAQAHALEKAAVLVGHMVEKLASYKPADKDAGEKAEGVFRDSLVENLREFVPLLRTFNLHDDPKVNALADKMEAELCQHDAADLRESDNAREKVAKAAEKILADVSKFMA